MKRKFRSELDFLSIIKVAAVLGFGSGLVLSLSLLAASLFNLVSVDDLAVILQLTLVSTLGMIFNATLGYPLYKLYCNKVKGQVVSGKFLEVTDENV